MKAILISIKPKWCAKIMNGEKTIEVRKNKALASAIQKLIDEYGFADIYVYCSKSNTQYLVGSENKVCEILTKPADTTFSPNIDKYTGNGKVVFKFRCYKVEEIRPNAFALSGLSNANYFIFRGEHNINEDVLTKLSCLSSIELDNYLKRKKGYAIHISDLEIFDEPKELSEFYTVGFDKALENSLKARPFPISPYYIQNQYLLRKAPQNFCYVEVE